MVGLQAIATAKRLGGSIKAVDVREDARKAADSLGAKVAGFEMPAELAIDADGYTKALSSEWLEKERAAIAPHVAEADIVILSALVSGEVAPMLVTEEMVRQMKPGSVIVDVSIDQGGNCAVTEPGHDSMQHQVHVCGQWNIPGSMPVHASWLYANNMLHYVQNLFKKGLDKPDLDDEIVQHSLVTHQGTDRARGRTEIDETRNRRRPRVPGRTVSCRIVVGRIGSRPEPNRSHAVKDLLLMVSVFVGAFVIGYFLVSRVPPRLHTPLMSMTNAISAVTILGGILLVCERAERVPESARRAGDCVGCLQRGRRIRHHGPHVEDVSQASGIAVDACSSN